MGTNFDDARIYCRVAPNTTGGSGVIAAYSGKDGTGDILWSWHIWVTDYNPDPTGDEDVQNPVNKRKQKYVRGAATQLPMMDRNLGAVAGYAKVPETELERSKANGFMYQWGRKDPFRSSYTEEIIGRIDFTNDGVVVNINTPAKGVLSCYKSDGITFSPMKIWTEKGVTYREAYKDITTVYKLTKLASGETPRWITMIDDEYSKSWGMGTNKGLHDPCPAGWRVCSPDNFKRLFSSGTTLSQAKDSNSSTDGGFLLTYDANDPNKTTYYRLPGYWFGGYLGNIGTFGYYWTNSRQTSNNRGDGGYPLRLKAGESTASMDVGGHEFAVLLIRCIQERAD